MRGGPLATPEEPRSPLGPAAATARGALSGRPRAVLAILVAGSVLAFGTAAVAKILNPELAAMPPVIRHPPVAASAPSVTGTGAPLVASSTDPSAAAASAAAPSPSRRTSPGRSEPTPPLVLSFEAEAAQRSSRPMVRHLPGASGGRIVERIGFIDEYVRFVSVNLPAAGRYALTVYYVSGSPRSADLRVNAGPRSRLQFPATPSWTTVRPWTVQVTLAAGANTIELWNVDGSYAPHLDRVTITR